MRIYLLSFFTLLCIVSQAQRRAAYGNFRYKDTVSIGVLRIPTGAASGKVLVSNANGYASWSTAPAITLPISSLTDATGTNTLNINNNTQTWAASGLNNIGFFINSSSTASTSNNNRLIQVQTEGANSASGATTYGVYTVNTHTGSTSTNVGVFSQVSGATNNYAIIVPSSGGSVGIGTSTPVLTLEVTGRMGSSQGADVASANNLTVGTDGNSFEITGTTQINLISNTSWKNGSEIVLHLESGITVKHNQTTSGSNIKIMVPGAVDLVTTAATTVKAVLCEVGGTQQWRITSIESY